MLITYPNLPSVTSITIMTSLIFCINGIYFRELQVNPYSNRIGQTNSYTIIYSRGTDNSGVETTWDDAPVPEDANLTLTFPQQYTNKEIGGITISQIIWYPSSKSVDNFPFEITVNTLTIITPFEGATLEQRKIRSLSLRISNVLNPLVKETDSFSGSIGNDVALVAAGSSKLSFTIFSFSLTFNPNYERAFGSLVLNIEAYGDKVNNNDEIKVYFPADGKWNNFVPIHDEIPISDGAMKCSVVSGQVSVPTCIGDKAASTITIINLASSGNQVDGRFAIAINDLYAPDRPNQITVQAWHNGLSQEAIQQLSLSRKRLEGTVKLRSPIIYNKYQPMTIDLVLPDYIDTEHQISVQFSSQVRIQFNSLSGTGQWNLDQITHTQSSINIPLISEPQYITYSPGSTFTINLDSIIVPQPKGFSLWVRIKSRGSQRMVFSKYQANNIALSSGQGIAGDEVYYKIDIKSPISIGENVKITLQLPNAIKMDSYLSVVSMSGSPLTINPEYESKFSDPTIEITKVVPASSTFNKDQTFSVIIHIIYLYSGTFPIRITFEDSGFKVQVNQTMVINQDKIFQQNTSLTTEIIGHTLQPQVHLEFRSDVKGSLLRGKLIVLQFPADYLNISSNHLKGLAKIQNSDYPNGVFNFTTHQDSGRHEMSIKAQDDFLERLYPVQFHLMTLLNETQVQKDIPGFHLKIYSQGHLFAQMDQQTLITQYKDPQIRSESIFLIPLTIFCGSLISTLCLLSKVYHMGTYLWGTLYSIFAIVELVANLVTLGYMLTDLSVGLDLGQKIFIMSFGIVYLLNFVSFFIFFCKISNDKKFQKWRGQKGHKYRWNIAVTIISLILTHKFKNILFCKLFNSEYFKAQLESVQKFKILNLFSFLSFFPSVGMAIGIVVMFFLNPAYQSNFNSSESPLYSQQFMFNIDALIMISVVCLLSFLNSLKDRDFFKERDSDGNLIGERYFCDSDDFRNATTGNKKPRSAQDKQQEQSQNHGPRQSRLDMYAR